MSVFTYLNSVYFIHLGQVELKNQMFLSKLGHNLIKLVSN